MDRGGSRYASGLRAGRCGAHGLLALGHRPPRVFAKPTLWDVADAAVEALRNLPNAVLLEPGPRHWNLFIDLCRRMGANGRLVPDAYLAALA
jgi:hypothetical protein